MRPEASRARREASRRAAFIRTRVRTAVIAVVGPDGQHRVRVRVPSQGAHIVVRNPEALVEEGAQARGQHGIMAGKVVVEEAPPQVEELVGEREVPHEHLPGRARGPKLEEPLELPCREADRLEVAALGGAVASFGQGWPQLPLLVEMRRGVAHETTRGRVTAQGSGARFERNTPARAW